MVADWNCVVREHRYGSRWPGHDGVEESIISAPYIAYWQEWIGLLLARPIAVVEGHWPRQGSTGRLLRSAGFRFALVYAVLLALSAAALAMFLWWATAGLLDRQTEAAIQADSQSLSERFNAGRIPALILTIDDRLTQNVEDDAIYLLVDPS